MAIEFVFTVDLVVAADVVAVVKGLVWLLRCCHSVLINCVVVVVVEEQT